MPVESGELERLEAEFDAAEPRSRDGRGLTADQIVSRNAWIATQAARGKTYRTIQRELRERDEDWGSISIRQIGNIVRKGRELRMTELAQFDVMDHVQATLLAYEQAAEELTKAADQAPPEHVSTKVGAIRTRVEVEKARFELLQACGLVPKALGTVRVSWEASDYAERMLRVAEAFGAPESFFDAMLEVAEGRDPQLPGGPQWDATGDVVEELPG